MTSKSFFATSALCCYLLLALLVLGTTSASTSLKVRINNNSHDGGANPSNVITKNRQQQVLQTNINSRNDLQRQHHQQRRRQQQATTIVGKTESSLPSEQQLQQQQIQQGTVSTLQQEQRIKRFVTGIMVLTGITEAICFRKWNFFPNMMTGNTVRCMDSVAQMKFYSAFQYATLIGSYIIGSGIPKALDNIATNNNNNSNSNSKLNLFGKERPTLVNVGRIALVVLGLSDFISTESVSGLLYKLSVMAFAFGMINAVTQTETGTVTNAVTGHWGKIGEGAANRLFLPKSTTRFPNNTPTNNKAANMSLRCTITFMVSIVASTLVMIGSEKYLSSATKPGNNVLRIPPIGITLGLLYNILFDWYCRVPKDDAIVL